VGARTDANEQEGRCLIASAMTVLVKSCSWLSDNRLPPRDAVRRTTSGMGCRVVYSTREFEFPRSSVRNSHATLWTHSSPSRAASGSILDISSLIASQSSRSRARCRRPRGRLTAHHRRHIHRGCMAALAAQSNARLRRAQGTVVSVWRALARPPCACGLCGAIDRAQRPGLSTSSWQKRRGGNGLRGGR